MNHSKHRIGMLVLILICLSAICPMALAQVTNASLTGFISDANGAALSGVQISVQNTNTNFVQSTVSNASGIYLVSPLNPGPYTLTAEKKGFRKLVQTGITLTVDQAATLNVTLQLGDVKEVVTVTADAELINTTTAEVGTTIGEEAVVELPLNGRQTSSLVLLSTGVINVLNTNGGKYQGETTMPDATGASAGGGRQGSTYYMLDGAPNMDTYMSLSAPFPDPDATQEFRVITNNYDAHYGFAPGAIVTIQTKSGANQFHGAAYDFGRNQLANASSYWGHNVDGLHKNIFGGSVGGPIFKDKFFFFGNYEHTHNGTQSNNSFANFPTARMFTGDFSEFSGTINGPDNLFVNNKINIALHPLSPGALAFAAAAMPIGTANVAGNPGYTEYPGAPGIETYKQGTTRLDYTINNKQRVFQRSFIEYYQNVGSAIKGNYMAISAGKTGRFYNEAMGHTWTIDDHTVNTVNVYYTQMDVLQVQPVLDTSGNPVCLSKFIAVHEIPGHCYMMGFGVSGGTNGAWGNWTEPTGERRYTFGFSDAYTKSIGDHTFSAGIDLLHQFAQENTDYPATPHAQFWGAWTGNGMADFLTGQMSDFTQGGGEISSVKGWMVGAYVQDQYKIKPNLTLTAGVRWDPNTPPTNTGGRGSSWRPGVQSTVFPNAPLGMIFPGDAGLTASLMPSSLVQIDPRIGLVYQPKSLPKTSFRVGFGIFTGPLQYSAYNHTSDIAPFSPTFDIQPNPGAVVNHIPTASQEVLFDHPWNSFVGGDQFANNNFASLSYKPPTNSPIVTPVNLQAEFSPNFKMGVTQSWNFSVEQQVTPTIAVHAAYVGSESYHQSVVLDANAAGVGAGQLPGVRPYSKFSGILVDSSVGTSPYNSLQIGFDKRVSHGLALQSSFTWSKVEDIASTGNISFTGGLGDPFNLRWNRGISDENVPLVWVSNFVYKSPALKGMNSIIRNTLGGWELSGIYTWQSGQPFGIRGGVNSSDNSGSLQWADRADVVPGQAAWSKRGSRTLWLNEYFNVNAFQGNAPNTFGNSGKNIFKGPAQQYGDSGLSKHFKVYSDKYDLQLRFEMFNVFNHASFGLPDNNPNDLGSGFGKITGQGAASARVSQGSVKFNF